MFQACRDDLTKFCPELRPTSPKELFESECFKSHEDELQAECKKVMDEWRKNPTQPSYPNPPPPPPPSHPIAHPSGGGGTTGSGAVGTPFYEACNADRNRFCPEIRDPFTEPALFETKCFQNNIKSLSPACKTFYEKFVINKHFVVGMVISASMIMMASGVLALLATCCCVACCVRLCVKRRNNRKTLALSIKATEDTELGAVPVKSVNVDENDQGELSQTQFVFPNQQFPAHAAFSPYSAPQGYMQPVFTVVQQ